MIMKSIARSPFKYAGELVQPKTEFSVKSARDAKLLAAMKRAVLLVETPVKVEPEVQTKRAYKRRDMVAESPVSFQAPPLRNPGPPDEVSQSAAPSKTETPDD